MKEWEHIDGHIAPDNAENVCGWCRREVVETRGYAVQVMVLEGCGDERKQADVAVVLFCVCVWQERDGDKVVLGDQLSEGYSKARRNSARYRDGLMGRLCLERFLIK